MPMMVIKPQFSPEGAQKLKACLEFAARNSAQSDSAWDYDEIRKKPASGTGIFKDTVAFAFFSKFPKRDEASFVVEIRGVLDNSSRILALHPGAEKPVQLAECTYDKLKPDESLGMFFASETYSRAYFALRSEQDNHFSFQPYLLDSIKITSDFVEGQKPITFSAFALGYLPPSSYTISDGD